MKNAFLLCCVAFCSLIQAHDYWLEPDNFFPAPGSVLNAKLYVGDKFEIELEREFQKDRTLKLDLVSESESKNLLDPMVSGQTPFVKDLALPEAFGTYMIVTDRSFSSIELEAAKFNAYLKEEGLQSILEKRRAQNLENTPGRERYARSCVKAILQIGDTYNSTPTKVIGGKLEIIPQQNPYTLKLGSRLECCVLYDGKPLADLQMEAFVKNGKEVLLQTITSDANGKFSVEIAKSGVWMIRTVYMTECLDKTAADWESWWTSVTFFAKG